MIERRRQLAAWVLVACFAACRGAPPADTTAIDPVAYVAEAVAFVRHESCMPSDRVEQLTRDTAQRGSSVSSLAEAHGVVAALVQGLQDGHSRFLPPSWATSVFAGSFVGTGLEPTRDGTWVMTVFADSPAARAGIGSGDRVLAIEGHDPAVMDESVRARLLRFGIDSAGRVGAVDLVLQRASGECYECRIDADCYGAALRPVARKVGADVACLEVPGCLQWGSAGREFAQAAHDAFESLGSDTRLKGWVVDLRRNTGGHVLATLAAVAPLVGNGPLGGFTSPRDERLYLYRDGFLSLGDLWFDVPRPSKPRRRLPVAVLVSRETASAAEAAVIALRAARQVRVFGEPTAGLTTHMAMKWMPDGAMLNIAKGYCMTNTMDVVAGRVMPDVSVVVEWGTLGTPNDPAIQAAAAWIRSR